MNIIAMDWSNHDGFQTFSWLSDLIGIPLNQINFIITQVVGLFLAGVLRKKLNPRAVSANARHTFGLVVGLAFSYYCFGNKALHIVGLPALCYIAMYFSDPKYMQRIVLFISLTYLSCIHIYRQIHEYGSYNIDVTGPLMVITQKVTSLAFNLHDGLARKPEELSKSQKQEAVYKMPSLLEFFSYNLHFQALMAGPIILYRDYIDFIHGRHFKVTQLQNGNHGEKSHEVDITSEPSPTLAVCKKVAGSVLCALVMVSFIPMYPVSRIKDEEFLQNTSIIYKMWYLIMTTMLSRFKYFFAWIFADAVCNNSGLGFNGYDHTGKSKWDLISNVDAFKFETATNLRDAITAWNKGTNTWLRSVVYERATRCRTIYTYALSAVWHGFYPGYYLTFANGALFTFSARAVRRHLRPHFLGSKIAKLFYDATTIVTTRIFLSYISFSFILLELQPSINLYLHMYLIPHILGIGAIIFLPMLPKSRYSDKQQVSYSNNKSPMRNGHSLCK